MEIRYITPADDRMEISRVYEESWKWAYRGIIPQDYLESIPKGRWAPGVDKQGWETLVCADGGGIVGTSSFCASRSERFPGWGEVVSIYLLPEYTGKGLGRVLMESAVSGLKKRGYEDIFLWVLEENVRARRFYERFGFSPAGEYLDDRIGGRALRELRYIYSVNAN